MDYKEFLDGLHATLQEVAKSATPAEAQTEETVVKAEVPAASAEEVTKLREQITKQETTIAALQATQTTIADGIAQVLKAFSPDEEGSLVQKMSALEAEQNGQGEVLTTVVENLGKLVSGSAVRKSGDGQDGAAPKLETVRKTETAPKSIFGNVVENMMNNPGKPVSIGS